MTERDGGVTFVVRVVPRASGDAIEGEHGAAGGWPRERVAEAIVGRAFERTDGGC